MNSMHLSSKEVRMLNKKNIFSILRYAKFKYIKFLFIS